MNEIIRTLNVKIKSNDSFYFSFSSVQLTETSTSAKLNVLLDAISPLLSYIFVLQTISDADAAMPLLYIAKYHNHASNCVH